MDSLFGQPSEQEEIQIFPCPTCSEMIRADKPFCPQCGTPVDAQQAALLVKRQKKLNRVHEDASLIVLVARAAAALGAASLIPVFGAQFFLLFCLSLLAVPLMVAGWFLYYFVPLQSAERLHPDLQEGKRRIFIAMATWGAVALLWLLLKFLLTLVF